MKGLLVHHAGRTFAEDLDIGFNPLGVSLFTNLVYFFRTSSGSDWHQAHADLGKGAGRDHGLCARSGEAAGDAVDFKRRPRPCAIEQA